MHADCNCSQRVVDQEPCSRVQGMLSVILKQDFGLDSRWNGGILSAIGIVVLLSECLLACVLSWYVAPCSCTHEVA